MMRWSHLHGDMQGWRGIRSTPSASDTNRYDELKFKEEIIKGKNEIKKIKLIK